MGQGLERKEADYMSATLYVGRFFHVGITSVKRRIIEAHALHVLEVHLKR